MNKSKPNYKRQRLRSQDDVRKLCSLIEEYGGFTMEDYISCWKKARESKVRFQMLGLLQARVLPLVALTCEKGNETDDKVSRFESKHEQLLPSEFRKMRREEEQKFFAKKYHASDFTVEDECILIGDWHLRSKRIWSIHPAVLKRIDHEFTIAKEFERENEFHFVPYTDLSYLLKSAKQIEEDMACETVVSRVAEYVRRLISNPSYFQEKIDECDVDNLWYRHIDEDKKLFKTMKNFGLIKEDEEFSSFYEKIKGCCISIPLSDVEIFDGYINASTSNISLAKSKKWERLFKVENYFRGFGLDYLYEKMEDVQQIFVRTLNDSIMDMDRKEFIRIDTYLTETGFKATVKYQLGFNNISALTSNAFITIPIDYLLHKENDGIAWIASLPHYFVENLLCSEEHYISQTTMDEYDLRVNELRRDPELKSIIESMSRVKEYDIREVPSLYLGREFIRHFHADGLKEELSRNPNGYRIFRFLEDYSHASDIGSWRNGYKGKSTESSVSFVVVDYLIDRIWLCPSNSKYSVYQFAFHPYYCSIETAVLALIKYYSSGICNKREGSGTPVVLKQFGLMRFSIKYKW